MRHLTITATLLAAFTAACGTASTATGLGSGPSPLAAEPNTGVFRAYSVDPKASCPDGHYPEGFKVSLNADGGATFMWNEVLGVTDYQIEAYHYGADNEFKLALSVSEDKLNRDYLFRTSGRYRARIRTRSCDTHYGPWSEWLVFSTDGHDDRGRIDPVVVPIPAPQPPVVPPVDPPPSCTNSEGHPIYNPCPPGYSYEDYKGQHGHGHQ